MPVVCVAAWLVEPDVFLAGHWNLLANAGGEAHSDQKHVMREEPNERGLGMRRSGVPAGCVRRKGEGRNRPG